MKLTDITDYARALRLMLEYCKQETGKSHQGYFGPGGWAYETASELLAKIAAGEITPQQTERTEASTQSE